MKDKRQQLLFVLKPCPTFMILCLLIVNRVKGLVIFDDELPGQVGESHVGLCVVPHDGVEADGDSPDWDEAFDSLWVCWAKHCHDAASEWMVHENCIFKSTLLNDLVDFLTCALHWYIEKAFLYCLLIWCWLRLLFEKWWTIIDYFSWKFKANELVLVWRDSSDSNEQVVFICESYLPFSPCVIDFRKFFSKLLSNHLLRIWSLILPVFWVHSLFLSFAHLKIF